MGLETTTDAPSTRASASTKRRLAPAAHLAYLRQMGVEYLEVRIPSAQSGYEDLLAIRRKVEGAGLKVFEIMLADKYNSPDWALGLVGRDKEIAFFQNFLRDLGRAESTLQPTPGKLSAVSFQLLDQRGQHALYVRRLAG